MSSLRAVVVGCGRFGAGGAPTGPVASHASAYARDPRFELVGLSDPHREALAAARARWRTRGHEDAVALCREERPDVVSIASATTSHAAVALGILEAAPPRCLVVEKPLASDAAPAAAVLAAARAAGTSVCVNYTRRFTRAFQALRDDLQRGVVGVPAFVRLTYGKGLANNGSHALDLLRMLFGDPVAERATKAPWAAGGPGDDACVEADLTLPGGARARLEVFDERIATVFELDLFTSTSRVRATLSGRRIERFDRVEGGVLPGYGHYLPASALATTEDALRDAFPGLVDAVAAHLNDGAPLPCTGEDGVAALVLVERLRGMAS